jgi:hypothetical protein
VSLHTQEVTHFNTMSSAVEAELVSLTDAMD